MTREYVSTADAAKKVRAAIRQAFCCVCFKELTDPISLERGIGPDCLQHKTSFVRSLAKDGRSLEHIRYLTGMPVDFITGILSEARS
jgi:hypothetical protein